MVSDVLKTPSKFEEVFAGMPSDEAVVRARAADAVEKITRIPPALLAPFKKQLLHQIARLKQKEVRWHVAQLLSRVPLTGPERSAAVELLLGYLKDESSIVKTCALQSLWELARQDETLREMVTARLDEAVRTGTPAMRARAR